MKEWIQLIAKINCTKKRLKEYLSKYVAEKLIKIPNFQENWIEIFDDFSHELHLL